MKDRQVFAGGMAQLGIAFNREITKPMYQVYWGALREISDEAYESGIEALLSSWQPTRAEWFPVPATVRRYCTPHVDVDALAITAFERVRSSGTYHAVNGTTYAYRVVAEKIGTLEAEAFIAAGGGSAFATQQTEAQLPWLRKAFVEAFKRGWEAKDQGREQLPAATVNTLPGMRRLAAMSRSIGNGPLQPEPPAA